MQQLKIPTSFWRRLQRRFSLQRPLLVISAALIAMSTVTALLQYHQDAHAAVPQYSQEATGFGDRSFIGAVNNEFTVDNSGNVFASVNGSNNNYIRKFSATGTFVKDFYHPDLTIASQASYRRMAVDASNNLYVINATTNTIFVFNNDGVYQTTISTPVPANADIVFDHLDNYYLTDRANHRIKKYAHDGTFLYNIGGPTAGTADGQFNTPSNITVDSQNNLIVSDTNNYRIQMFTSTGTFIRKFGQRNAAVLCPTQPSLDSMTGVNVDGSDNIYIVTHGTSCPNYVQKYTNAGVFVATQTRPNYTYYQRTTPGGNVLYSLESETYIGGVLSGMIIATYDPSGTAINNHLVGGIGKQGRAVATAQDSAGNTYVADATNYRIQKYDSSHAPVLTIGSYGTGNGQFRNISSVAVDQSDNVYVSDYYLNTVQKFSSTGTYLGKFGGTGTTDGLLQNADKVAVRADGTIAVLDNRTFGNSRVQFFQPDGTFVSKLAVGNIANFALKDDGTLALYTSYTVSGASQFYITQYDTTNTQIGSPAYVLLTDSDTGIAFRPTIDIAYDHHGNLYALGFVSSNPQTMITLARLNLTNPDLAPYEVIVPQINDIAARLSFTASNQLLISSPQANYVYQYDVASLLNAPNTPLNLTATSPADRTLSVSWQTPSGPTVAKYLVEYRPYSAMQWLRYEVTTGTTSTLTGLVDDQYDVRVSAMNVAGFSPAAQTDNHAVTAAYGYAGTRLSPDAGQIHGLAFGPDGRRYDIDSYNARVNIYNADGSFSHSFGSYGTADGQFQDPKRPAIYNNQLFVPDYQLDRVQVFDLDGNFLRSFGQSGTGPGQLWGASQVIVDGAGTIYVLSEYQNINTFDQSGNFIAQFAADTLSPTSMVRDANGNTYVASADDYSIHKYDAGGTVVSQFAGPGNEPGQLWDVFGMLINPAGQLVVNDSYNDRLSLFTTDGAFLYTIGRTSTITGEYLHFEQPLDLAQNVAGDLYIPDGWSSYLHLVPYITAPTGGPTATVPTSPQAVLASSPSAGTLSASWQAPASDGGQAVVSYLLEYKPSAGNAWSQVTVPSTNLTHSLTNVPAGDYDIRVSATNSVGTSLPSVIASTTVSAPATPPAPSPSPVAPLPIVVTTPTSPYVAPPAPVHPPAEKSAEATPPAPTKQPAPSSAITITPQPSDPSRATISWQPPAAGQPSYYVIEYQDRTNGSSPWRQIGRTPGDQTSTEVTLPEGDYTVRVAAIMPGETATRIIVGVAHITIPAKRLAASPATKAPLPLWIMVCSALLTIATFILIPFLIWKRRRKAAAERARQASIPPRWQ